MEVQGSYPGLEAPVHRALTEPILLAGTLDTAPANGARLVALADGAWRDEALGFDRVFLLFDNSRIDDARATWRALGKVDGVELHFWKQDERGRWYIHDDEEAAA